MILPRLQGKRFSYWNANSWAYDMAPAVEDASQPRRRSAFLEPRMKERLSENAMRTLAADCLYGGYLEDRSYLWKGSYMEPSKFLHLGIDFVAPAGTAVCIDERAELVQVYCDTPEESGWGTRLMFRLLDHPDIHLVYGHLAPAKYDPNHPNDIVDPIERAEAAMTAHVLGRYYNSGWPIGYLGTPEQNGGWSAHLHVQAIRGPIDLFLDRPDQLDGYAELDDLPLAAERYPDPMRFISIR